MNGQELNLLKKKKKKQDIWVGFAFEFLDICPLTSYYHIISLYFPVQCLEWQVVIRKRGHLIPFNEEDSIPNYRQ